MKTNYSSIILRYVHDVVTGEFANIGVVLYAPNRRFLEARFATSYERLNAIFLKIDHLHFRALMRYLANRFEELSGEPALQFASSYIFLREFTLYFLSRFRSTTALVKKG